LLYRNYLYLDIEKLPEFHASPRAVEAFKSAEVQAELESLRASDAVEYERVARIKLCFLRRIFVHGIRHGSINREELRRWTDDEGEGLQRFATYCALGEFLHRRNPNMWNFPEWPQEFQHPDSPAVAEFRKKHARNIEFY